MSMMDIGAVTRVQDYTIIKHNEDQKSAVDSHNSGEQVQKNTTANTQEVVDTDHPDWHEHRQDAKEKGSNAYYGDGGKQRRDKNGRPVLQDRVVVKGKTSGFDFKI